MATKLSRSKQRILAHIKRFGPCGARVIAQVFRLRTSAISHQLWELHVMGEVQREKVEGRFEYHVKEEPKNGNAVQDY